MITDAFLEILDAVRDALTVPAVRTAWFPPPPEGREPAGKFGAVVLDDGTVGIAWAGLPGAREAIAGGAELTGADPVELARGIAAEDLATRTVALAAMNAVTHHVLVRAGVELDTVTDPLEPFEPSPKDSFGMVGYFPPLARRLRKAEVPFVVLEKRPDLVPEGTRVTGDASELEGCNKILCTSTVVLNDTFDDILSHAGNADCVAVLGPSASFFPDPLFARGVHVIGGTRVVDAEAFLDRCRTDRRWRETTEKYTFTRARYAGFGDILARAVG